MCPRGLGSGRGVGGSVAWATIASVRRLSAAQSRPLRAAMPQPESRGPAVAARSQFSWRQPYLEAAHRTAVLGWAELCGAGLACSAYSVPEYSASFCRGPPGCGAAATYTAEEHARFPNYTAEGCAPPTTSFWVQAKPDFSNGAACPFRGARSKDLVEI